MSDDKAVSHYPMMGITGLIDLNSDTAEVWVSYECLCGKCHWTAQATITREIGK